MAVLFKLWGVQRRIGMSPFTLEGRALRRVNYYSDDCNIIKTIHLLCRCPTIVIDKLFNLNNTLFIVCYNDQELSACMYKDATWTKLFGDGPKCSELQWILSLYRCASVVKTGVRSPALHAAACANPGQRDEDERSHEHKTTPLLTLLFTSWLELKAPPCKCRDVHSTDFTNFSVKHVQRKRSCSLIWSAVVSPRVQVWGGILPGLWSDVYEGLRWRQEHC